MTQATNTEMPLICSIVNDADRINILPRYAGRHFIQLESLIYNVMGEYSKDYDGGFWIMWELSNGAFYMAPGDKTETYPMSCAGNWYEGTMSADAAGIVTCLVAFNRMAWHTREDRFTNLFYGLREWALEHPEAKEIFAAID
ncbi:TPA: antirestriction protein [Proteus mirabilis]